MKSILCHVHLLRVQLSGKIQPELSNYLNAIRNIICKKLLLHTLYFKWFIKKESWLISRDQSLKLISFMF